MRTSAARVLSQQAAWSRRLATSGAAQGSKSVFACADNIYENVSGWHPRPHTPHTNTTHTHTHTPCLLVGGWLQQRTRADPFRCLTSLMFPTRNTDINGGCVLGDALPGLGVGRGGVPDPRPLWRTDTCAQVSSTHGSCCYPPSSPSLSWCTPLTCIYYKHT
jgi:hypothetical protein